MREIYIGMVIAALCMGMLYNVHVLADSMEQVERERDGIFQSNRSCNFFKGYDPFVLTDDMVDYPLLQLKDAVYAIPRGTPYFRCYFKRNEAALKFEVKKAWITYEFVNQEFGEVQTGVAHVDEKAVMFQDVFSGVDVQYTIESDSVLEEVVLHEYKDITELVQKIVFEGVTPVETEEGILFTNGERFLFGIPPPVMYELDNKQCCNTGLHYELDVRDNTYYLKKVIDEKGLAWLKDPERVYPVVMDATTQSFEDVWENTGLQPYNQYFENLSEYVSPNGDLTIKQTDFYLPGRGLDVDITRVYTVPAVFSTMCGVEGDVYPYEYEAPPVDIGEGWQLNFPWVGPEYIHYVDGSLYKKSENHVGHHFSYDNNVLTTASGVEYSFSGGIITAITDTDGNTITFGYTNGKLTTITDTVGRVINLSYNQSGKVTQISYGAYTVAYTYVGGVLQSVTDPAGRVTTYQYDEQNMWLLTDIVYPTGGLTHYNYHYFAQQGQCYPPGSPVPHDIEYRKYHVLNQAVYSPQLVKNTCYSYEGDFDQITKTTVTVKNEQNIAKVIHEFTLDSNGLTTEHTVTAGGTQLRKIIYTYTTRKEVKQKEVYTESYAYTEKYVYDSWGNVIYQENGEGEKVFSCYGNTNYENVFREYDGTICEFSNQFFDSAIPSSVHTAVLGSVHITSGTVIETYCNYTNGHLIEMRQLFQGTPDSSLFSDIFNEDGQTSFSIDLTGVELSGDAVLMVTGVPRQNQVIKTETHSVYKYCNWLNQGYWQQNTFYAKYIDKKPPYTTDYEPVGPFTHYPGTSGYQIYTTWVSGYNQYVKTTYTEPVDKYPQQVEYHLNGDWHTITSHLENNTVYCSIPVEALSSGTTTLTFKESSSWTTAFEWTLYVPHAVQPIQDVSTVFTYDIYGNMTSVTNALGNITSFTYDSQYHAYVTGITNALNYTTTAAYDMSRGFLTAVTDPQGNTVSFAYDILGRVTKRIHPDQTEVEAVYNDQSNTVTVYNELDNYTKQYYDGLNRLTKTEWYLTDTMYLTETCTYNYLNKIKTVTDQRGHVSMYEYDPLGRPTKVFNPDLTFKQIQYTHNTAVVFDENCHKTAYSYDWVGRLVQVKEYINAAEYYLTEYTYNTLGQLTSFTDGNGNTTSYVYDSLFGVTHIIYPDSTTETFSYDDTGNILQKTDAHGITSFVYNAINQLTDINYPDQSLTFAYDANGNRTLTMDAEGQTEYTYDNRNRLTSETRTIDGILYTVGYTYDAASRLTAMTYPDQTVVTYEYDALNRLTTVPGYAQFTHTALLLSSITFANGVETDYHYDNRNRPTTIHAVKDTTDLLYMDYQYDPVNNITQLGYNRRLPDHQWEQSTKTFSYDWSDRLISAQDGSNSYSYSYDPVGNRLSLNTVLSTYNVMNELISTSDGTVFTYDDTGNLLTKTNEDTWSFTYDAKNQLIQVEKNQQLMNECFYDGNNRRIKKIEWIESVQEYHTKIYVYSGLDVIYEKNITTNQEALYVYGPTGKIAKKSDGLTDYYITDHLGSTRLIIDESENVITTVDYKSFGKDTVTGEKDSCTYNGKERDSTGLYYYGTRYYDPKIGRFITRDIVPGRLTNPQTLNRYTYVLNNPLKYRDPDGCEQAGALLGKKGPGYPGQGTFFENTMVYITWSQNPLFIGTNHESGNPLCVVGMIILVGSPFLAPIIALLKVWWIGLGNLAKGALIGLVINFIIMGTQWIYRKITEDNRFEIIEWDSGHLIFDREKEEIIEGERWINGTHQVWVHVPGEGDLGGHWEDDLDCDGVADSVDDDNTDPNIGDEDPDNP